MTTIESEIDMPLRGITTWGALLGNEVLVTALLDRLLHYAEATSIQSKSYRIRDRLAAGKSKAAATQE